MTRDRQTVQDTRKRSYWKNKCKYAYMHVYTVIKTPKEERVIHVEQRHQKDQSQRKNNVDPVKKRKRKDRSEIYSKDNKHVYISAVNRHVYTVIKTLDEDPVIHIQFRQQKIQSQRKYYGQIQ